MNTASIQDINRAVIADRSSTIRRALGGRSIVLVGIMGVGKSTIGKRLSQYLDIPFVDADKEIAGTLMKLTFSGQETTRIRREHAEHQGRTEGMPMSQRPS